MDTLWAFILVDKYYIQNIGLNKLIYLDNGRLKFISNKYKINFELHAFPNKSPLYITGILTKEDFFMILKIELNLSNSELEELKNSIFYYYDDKLKQYSWCDCLYLK